MCGMVELRPGLANNKNPNKTESPSYCWDLPSGELPDLECNLPYMYQKQVHPISCPGGGYDPGAFWTTISVGLGTGSLVLEINLRSLQLSASMNRS